MAGNTIDFKGVEAVRAWNNNNRELCAGVQEDMHAAREILVQITGLADGDVADLLAQYATNIGSAADELYNGTAKGNEAVDKWAEQAEAFSNEAQAAIRDAANSL